jgi:hypothetical protein
MYKIIKSVTGQEIGVEHQVGNILYNIPFAPDNTDYQTFRKEVLAGAELQDADGNVMTQAEADAFIATLP